MSKSVSNMGLSISEDFRSKTSEDLPKISELADYTEKPGKTLAKVNLIIRANSLQNRRIETPYM